MLTVVVISDIGIKVLGYQIPNLTFYNALRKRYESTYHQTEIKTIKFYFH